VAMATVQDLAPEAESEIAQLEAAMPPGSKKPSVDVPKAWDNPVGTDGFEFVEYTAEDTEALGRLFEQLGFRAVARHRSKKVTLYRQGEINFLVNAEPESFAQSFARVHGPSACAIAIRVQDAAHAFERAVELGAKPYAGRVGPMELNIPAIKGLGDSLIYLVDRYGDRDIYDVDFVSVEAVEPPPEGVSLTYIDHLTHNVYRGRMDLWAGYYERLFNFRETRYFDIEGKLTGLHSRAMTSPCGKIRIPINESADDKSQIEEFLADYKGEGIQHIALGSDDIYATVQALTARGVSFMPPPPDSYYKGVDKRLPGHGEDLDRLKENSILIDGAPTEDGGLLLQIFTKTVIGPIFFEIIQRKGDEGFGEGNFQALFEAMEQDQIERGTL
jgi:4-hydroxyphenylpyruvate dioxygenase